MTSCSLTRIEEPLQVRVVGEGYASFYLILLISPAFPCSRRPRLRHAIHRRGAASAVSRPPQACVQVVEHRHRSAQPLAARSVQRLIPRCRWTVPTHWWAARPRSCPVAARPRTQTAAAPCLTSSPPGGSAHNALWAD